MNPNNQGPLSFLFKKVSKKGGSSLLGALLFLSLSSLAFLAYLESYQLKTGQYLQVYDAYLAQTMVELAKERWVQELDQPPPLPSHGTYYFNHGKVQVEAKDQVYIFYQELKNGKTYVDEIPVQSFTDKADLAI